MYCEVALTKPNQWAAESSNKAAPRSRLDESDREFGAGYRVRVTTRAGRDELTDWDRLVDRVPLSDVAQLSAWSEVRAAGRAAAEKAITTAKTCPVPEINRLGRTLTAWRTEFLARFERNDQNLWI